MTFSSEIENVKRAIHQTPIFVGKFSRSMLNISSEIFFFKIRALWERKESKKWDKSDSRAGPKVMQKWLNQGRRKYGNDDPW